jgi:hypothetical protein
MRIAALSCAAVVLAGSGAAHTQMAAPADPGAPDPALNLDLSVVARSCPQDGDEIVVCGRREPRSPYRLPEQPERFDPRGPMMSVSRERNAMTRIGGDTGMMSCSNVGPYGWMGCAFNAWRDAKEQHGK